MGGRFEKIGVRECVGCLPILTAFFIEEEFFARVAENADGEGVEKFVGNNQGLGADCLKGFFEGQMPVPFSLKSIFLALAEVWGDFDEVVVQFSSIEKAEMLADVASESAIAGAEFDNGEILTLSLPGFNNPKGQSRGESGGEFRRGGEITSRTENRPLAGVVSAGAIKGLLHESVETNQLRVGHGATFLLALHNL